MKAAFVTGATGFIGGYLIDSLLRKGLTVYVLTRNPGGYVVRHERVRVVAGDIVRLHSLPDDVGTVYHCSGVINREDLMEQVNVRGTQSIVEAALKAGCRLVHLSSAGVIGRTMAEHVDEDTPCCPQTLYEKTKLEAERVIKEGIAAGLKARILRPTIVFGTGRDPAKDSFLHLVRSIMSGRYRHIGNGEGVYNIIHAIEVVRAMCALDNDTVPNGGVYFINAPISFREFSSVVKEATSGETNITPAVPYSAAYCAAAFFSALSRITGMKVPLTLSRLRALTDKRTFSQERLLTATGYRPLYGVEHYIRLACKEYGEAGLLGKQ